MPVNTDVGSGSAPAPAKAPAWRSIFLLILAVWIALMVLPHDTVMWGLAVLAVSVIMLRWNEIAKL